MLDVGCGTATQLVQLSRGAPSMRPIEVDGDPEILERARSKIAAAEAAVELHQALADDLPLPDRSIEVAIVTLFLHHLAALGKRRAPTELHRALRPAGR